MKKIILLVLILGLGILGFFIYMQKNVSNTVNTHNVTPVIVIPSDIEYHIIKDTSQQGVKRVVQVRLNKRVSENVLKDIALKIKQINAGTYKRTFIGYYLVQHNKDYGYWATTNFDPHLKVKVAGATLEEEKLLTKKQEPNPARKIIGSWLQDTNFYAVRLTFFTNKDNEIFLESIYDDGSSGIKRMLEKNDPIFGRKLFEEKYYIRDGAYYLITPTQELELWNKVDGHYDTAIKLP